MKPINAWVQQQPPWLASDPETQGIVLSSRLRLARNLDQHLLRRQMDADAHARLVADLLPRVQQQLQWPHTLSERIDGLSAVQAQILVERHLASRELISAEAAAGIVLRADALAAVMINEEDHIRIQVLAPGMRLDSCLEQAVAIDEKLHAVCHWAYHQRYGYVTSCPTNLGTGMRASIMLHLPGIAESGTLAQVLRALAGLHMVARGMNGEGSQAQGHFYQISNQRALGSSEGDLISHINACVQDIISQEQVCRDALLKQRRNQVEDRVWRAWGLLTHARRLSSDEAIDQLSWLRWGLQLGLLRKQLAERVDQLLISCQSAHIQCLHPDALDPRQRDQVRASLIRSQLLP